MNPYRDPQDDELLTRAHPSCVHRAYVWRTYEVRLDVCPTCVEKATTDPAPPPSKP